MRTAKIDRKYTTITVLKDTWKELNQMRSAGEHFDQVIKRLLNSYVGSEEEVINA